MIVPETFFSVEEELFLFFASCLCGAFIGAYYDVFRAFRMLVPHKSAFIVIEDLVFLGSYAVFLSAFANVAARGELRVYYVIGNVLGAVLYFFTIGTFVTRTLGKLLRALKKFVGAILKPIRSIYKSIYVLLYKKAAPKFVGCSKIFVKLYKKLKILLQRIPNMLYNKTESKIRRNVKKVGKKKSGGQKARKAENKKAQI